MLASTTRRVRDFTTAHSQSDIVEELHQNVAFYSAAGPAAIRRRLEELEREWDVDRVVETHAAGASLVGLALGALVDRRFFAIPSAIAALLLSYALSGAYPPLLLFRKLGVRTTAEINEERYRLMIARGDFDAWAPDAAPPDRATTQEE